MRFFANNIKGIRFVNETKKQLKLPYALSIGQVVSCPDVSTREVKIISMEKDSYLNMFFNKSYKVSAHDEKKESIAGDLVLVRKPQGKVYAESKFVIDKIVFQTKHIVDPITGRLSSYEPDILQAHLEELQKKHTP